MSASSRTALEYLEGLPGVDHKKLYQLPSTVLAVFRRMLPHLAKSIVMAMLYMPGNFAAAELDAWIRPDAKADKDQAISVLQTLHILAIDNENPKAPAYRLQSTFAKSLRQALTGGGNHRSFGVPCTTPDPHRKSIQQLDKYARQQWEAILYFLVSSTSAGLGTPTQISASTTTLLRLGEFVTRRNGAHVITQRGFGFLLQEANAQIWTLLVVYLASARQLGMQPVEVLSFLFMLGSLELGQDYSTRHLTDTQKAMMDDLCDFGIVCRDRGSERFYPTRLATTLTSDAGALTGADAAGAGGASSSSALTTMAPAQPRGSVIIETNYRLYAYTTSPLQIAVLALFTRLRTRYPNLVAGKLTKDSVTRALATGITADQIITYLTVHAHPQMARHTPVLPPTVVDQIRLWQIEGDRMKATEGFLLRDFDSRPEFDEACEYAGSLGVLVWRSDARRMFFVNKIDQMKMFLANRASARKARAG